MEQIQVMVQYVQDGWDQYWPIIYDFLQRPPPLLWIILGLALLVMLWPMRRRRMEQEERERRLVADEVLNLLEQMAEDGKISWKAAEREMLRMGRNWSWGDFIPRRMKEYQLTHKEIEELKGRIRARREERDNTPADIPGPPPGETGQKKKPLSGGRIGQLIARHRL